MPVLRLPGWFSALVYLNILPYFLPEQFGVAIANAWLLRGEQLQEVNLFDNQNVPALSVEHADTIPDGEHSDDSPKAVLYVGKSVNW